MLKRNDDTPESNKRRRAARIDAKAVDESSRSVELSFSSETNTVMRWCYDLGGVVPEILSHRDGACDFQPLIEAGSVLRNHDPNQIIGVPESVRVEDLRGKASIRFGNSQLANETLRDVKDGILRGVSFGYEPLTEEYIRAGEKNAEGVAGPCIFVRKWRALEISLTPIPADATVGVGRAASTAKSKENPAVKTRDDKTEEDKDPKLKAAEDLEKKENEEAKKKEDEDKKSEKSRTPEVREAARAAIREERARVTEIRAAVKIAELPEDFGDDLIERGADIAEVNAAVIKEMGKRGPAPFRDGSGGHVAVTGDRVDRLARHLSVNLGRRCGIRDEADKDVEVQPMSLCGLAREFMAAFGVPNARNMTNEEVARKVFSREMHALCVRAVAGNTTVSIANALQNIQNKILLRAYMKAPATWRRWCRSGNVADFKLNSRVRLSDFADLKETKEDGEIQDSQISDTKETFRLAWYARMISLTWEMFINDDLDALSRLPAMMGAAAARLPSRLVYTHLLANGAMADGTALFHADHSNLDATAAAMDSAGIGRLIAKFRKQTTFQAPNETDAAEPLDIDPAFLLVPPELEFAGKRLVYSPADVTAEFSAGVVNPVKGILKDVVVEPRLSHASYTGYSTTAYYVLGDPETCDTVEVGFLDGNEQPRTDTFEDFDRLAMKFRAVLPCVAKSLDFRGMAKANGA